ncbi:MAG: MASE1 domain-containing protein [Nitrosomonadales bacterium]|nr:MASE1 domain-containing protein [Nitrosomonadales bacterium]
MRSTPSSLFGGLAFVAVYVLLDWASYLHPMYGLNITPWNPSLALGLVVWSRVGRLVAIPWFAAILIGEVVVRGLPATLTVTLLLSAVLTIGYGIMAEILRRRSGGRLLHDRFRLLAWLAVVVAGTLVTSTVYISLLYAVGLIPVGDWGVALVRFWVGDCVGIVVTMPFFWLLLHDRNALGRLFMRKETAAYIVLAVAALWLSFGLGGEGEFQYFYLLFPPIVWAAARQGVHGAAIAAFILQAGIIVAVQWQNLVAVTVFELQMLGAVLAFVGFFIGAVVDEKQRVSKELSQTLRLAAAGEMAAALAHELNQPLTALSAYGSACRKLLSSGGDDERLRDTIERMVGESHRAAEVVRRLRDFFRTGATRLEAIRLPELVGTVVLQFADKAAMQGIELTAASLPECKLFADRLQIEVVLRNLIANAVDAVLERPAGQRRIVVTADVAGRRLRITVKDSGAGLTAEQILRVFEAFQSTKSSGLGLGLAVSRAIAQAHGGDLVAASGEGGEFVLTLPLGGEVEDVS